MKKAFLLFALCATATAGAAEIVANPDTPFTERYVSPKVCGRWYWLTGVDHHNGPEIMASLGLDKVRGLRGTDPFAVQKSPIMAERIKLFREGKLPLLGFNFPYFATNNKYPTQEQIEQMRNTPNFLGWRGFNEWGTGLDRMLRAAFESITVSTPAGRGMAKLSKTLFAGKKNPKTREEFEKIAAFAWDRCNAPLGHEVYVLDGSHYWAKAWPGGWNRIRAVITENRTPYRSNQIMQAFTRGSARMWNVPFGYFCAYDWYARISPPMLSHMQQPRDAYRNQRGYLRINPSLYRRLWYYMMMSNAVFIGDESDHSEYIDLAGKGQFRLSWYGELCEEMRQFVADNDTGVSWNPVAVAISWHNGVVYKGDLAFYRYPYNDGEHMARELIHRVLFRFSENNLSTDDLGPSPFGELFDVVRLDTPRGPLPLDLLSSYPVLFLVGEQKFDPENVKRITEYVEQGGTLILNAAMLKGGEFPEEFLGASIGKPVKADSMTNPEGKKLSGGKFTLYPLTPLSGTRVLYRAGNLNAVTRREFGKGAVILCGPAWLLSERTETVNGVSHRVMLPVAADLMGRISAELLPFRISGDGVKDQLMFQVNRKGSGYVIGLFNNGGLTVAGESNHGSMGPETADPCKTLKIRLRMKKPMNHAVELISGERCYFSGSQNSRFLDFTLAPGEVRIVEISPDPIPDRKVRRRVNLALNKKVTATSSARNFGPEKAVDGNEDFMSAWWSDKACPQEMVVDLGKVQTIGSVRTVMAWSLDNLVYPRFQQYTVSASIDGKKYRTIVDESANVLFDTERGHHRFFAPVKARYLKLSVSFSSCRQGAQVIEFQAFAPDQWETVTLPWKTDPSKIYFPAVIRRYFTRKPLSELKPVSNRQSYQYLTPNAECNSGRELSIRGMKFPTGLGTHAVSEVVYHLDPADKWKIFTAYTGIDDVSAPVGTVEFLVYTDGKLAARSGRLTMSNQPVPIWANLEGVRELKLVVSDCDDGINGDIADWADACLRKE